MIRKLVLGAALGLLVLPSSSPAALADEVHVEASGATQFNHAAGAFLGGADFIIEGEEAATLAMTYLLELRPLPNGNILARTSHVFDFGGGNTVITYDHALLIPTETPGIYTLFSAMKVISGTGMFEGATGHLTVHGGTVNLITFSAKWDLTGVIALPG